MTKIAIIGVGQLGSRHLQALNLLSEPTEILVIDPSAQSLEVAQSRFEASIQAVKHSISYQQQMPSNDTFDIAIVASTAAHRAQVLKTLVQSNQVQHIVLEKILFTDEQDYVEAVTLIPASTRAWVNCCMRMMPFYQQLKQHFSNTATHYRVSGSQFGLVTNAIHYLDHLADLTGSTSFSLDVSHLDKQVIESKRAGYYELTGTLIAQYANGSMAYIHCDKQGNLPVQIEIYNHQRRVISRESEHKAWVSSQQTDWMWEEQAAVIPFQSTMTAELVNSLLTTNTCSLPDLQTSITIHQQLLQPLKVFLQASGVKTTMDYPFT